MGAISAGAARIAPEIVHAVLPQIGHPSFTPDRCSTQGRDTRAETKATNLWLPYFEVYDDRGYGLAEEIYQECLEIELGGQAMTGLLALVPLPGDALAVLPRASANTNWEIRDGAEFLLAMNGNAEGPDWRIARALPGLGVFSLSSLTQGRGENLITRS